MLYIKLNKCCMKPVMRAVRMSVRQSDGQRQGEIVKDYTGALFLLFSGLCCPIFLSCLTHFLYRQRQILQGPLAMISLE